MLPPKLVRRLVLTPLMLVLTAVFVLLSPLVALLAVLASPFLGNWRPLRLLWISLSYLIRDALSTLAFVGLWVASGFGRYAGAPSFQRAHYAVLRWFMGGLVNSGLRAVRSSVEITSYSDAEEALRDRRRPVLVFCRHAGAGDSFLLVHELLNRYGRRPRIVMKALLQWDPFIDQFGNRLPNRFVAGGGQELVDGIGTLAEGLDPDGALLIFPEGGNFTEDRRCRTIERLERDGHADAAERARKMDNLMAPRPGGALAATAGAPDADVVFIAHTGLPDPRSTGDLLRLVPLDHPVELGMWHVPAAEVPSEREEQIDWLFTWWCRLDSFIEKRGGGRSSSPTPTVVP